MTCSDTVKPTYVYIIIIYMHVMQIAESRQYLHETAKVVKVVNELEQLADVVGDGGTVRVHLTKVLLVNLAKSYKRMHK